MKAITKSGTSQDMRFPLFFESNGLGVSLKDRSLLFKVL